MFHYTHLSTLYFGGKERRGEKNHLEGSCWLARCPLGIIIIKLCLHWEKKGRRGEDEEGEKDCREAGKEGGRVLVQDLRTGN